MKNKKGVTLIEVVVVLALAAIVAGIAVSTSFGGLDKSRTTACDDARNDFIRVLMTEAALNTNDATAKLDEAGLKATTEASAADASYICTALASNTAFSVEGGCPEGGKWTVGYDANTGVFAVKCSVHGGASAGQNMNSVNGLLREPGELHDYIYGLSGGSAVDGASPGGAGLAGRTQAVINYVQSSLGIDLSAGYSWKIYCWSKGNPTLYFTHDYDLSNLPANVITDIGNGVKVPVTTYAWASDGTIKRGIAYIKKSTTPSGAIYYILVNASGGNTISTSTWDNISEDELP